MNFICVSGRLTKDPKYTTVGESTRVNFSIANNVAKDKVNFFNVVAFKGWAKNFRAKKGSLVMVTGALEQYKDKEGNERFSIVANSLMEAKPNPNSLKAKKEKVEKSEEVVAEEPSETDDDMPF